MHRIKCALVESRNKFKFFSEESFETGKKGSCFEKVPKCKTSLKSKVDRMKHDQGSRGSKLEYRMKPESQENKFLGGKIPEKVREDQQLNFRAHYSLSLSIKI